MHRTFTERKRFRKNLGAIKEVTTIPNLIDLQRASFEKFLHSEDSKKEDGIQNVLESFFPVKDNSGKLKLEFISYSLDKPKYTEEEARRRGLTFASVLRAVFRLTQYKVDEGVTKKDIAEIREQEVYICELPIMTKVGTFIVNGVERVIISQMQRSPGVVFDHDGGKTHSSGKYLFAGHVIPAKGSWLDFEFDAKDQIFVRLDRKKKMSLSTLLMALYSKDTEALIKKNKGSLPDDKSKITGMDKEEVLSSFYSSYNVIRAKNGDYHREFDLESWKGSKLENDLIDYKSKDILAKSGDKITSLVAKKLAEKKIKSILVQDADILGKYVAADVIDPKTGIVALEAGDEVNEENLTLIKEYGVNISLLDIDLSRMGAYIRNTIVNDKVSSREEALYEIYKMMRPGDPPTLDGAETLFSSIFSDKEKYDLSVVGRVKINNRLNLDISEKTRILTKQDILAILLELHKLKDGYANVDDIDNLGNRRIRSVGELLENQLRFGFVRIERNIKDRLAIADPAEAMPNDIINAKPIATAIKEFFASSQLSQFMDQTNPLSEITHKRRISSLGPGGLTRDRAGFEVRDVHPTHYGRICPIETPEGPNIGLISSLAIFARVNKYGFIETPYRKVVNGKVTPDITYFSATDEAKYNIAQANAHVDDKNKLVDEFVSCRKGGEIVSVPKEFVDYMDVSPKQLVSVAASLIPFLENDDASRTLMGANMQRQAVPLLRAEAPLVGTGMERIVAKDSGASLIASRRGIIDKVDANRIVIRVLEGESTVGVDVYNLRKFGRSNQSTCINQRPVVRNGDLVEAGDVIADSSGTELGELALGQNVKVGFMVWSGYNYEDAIVISERLIQGDKFTSIHIEEFEVMARDTKLGNEEITRDIPNISEEMMKNLDESGIINIGSEVRAGDILVGKITPKGESPMTPEEKLLRAIFGERVSDVKDSSLRLPPGCSGTVVDVKVFSRRGVEKDQRAQLIESREIESLKKDYDIKREIFEENYTDRLRERIVGKKYKHVQGVSGNGIVTEEFFDELTWQQRNNILFEDDEVNMSVQKLKVELEDMVNDLRKTLESDVEKIRSGDELPPGVLKTVKVYVAEKRKIQAGDKLAGRHGNKGIVSKIVPVEDMPHLEDGTPLDIILNPLGVTARMNIGQVLETHLGWACIGLGQRVKKVIENISYDSNGLKELKKCLKGIYSSPDETKDIDKMTDVQVAEMSSNLVNGVPVASPVFDGCKEAEIVNLLESVGFDSCGQTTLIDGRTGEPFDRKVTLGCIYMLKLDHMVDDKLHARSIGPYSLVTQQPLGGKAQFGGQRFGEMEVWALQAYGAANVLQEMLTIKSDDVVGRSKAYESIIKGDNNITPGIPESFNVLMKEICALGLNFEFQQRQADLEETEESLF